MKQAFLFFLLTGMFATYSCSTKKDMALDKANLDTSVQPGDDFYRYANGGWIRTHPIPGEFSRYGTFDVLAEENRKMLRSLIEEAASGQNAEGSIEEKVGTFFNTGMDTVTIEKEGLTPLQSDFSRIDAARTILDLQDLIALWHTGENSVLFNFYGSPDSKNSGMMIANLEQGGLGLTDVDYYRDQDPKAREIRETYQKYIVQMLTLSGETTGRAEADAALIMNMETRLANASMTRLERRDPHATYNKMAIADLEKLSPQFNWDGYLNTLGLSGLQEINIEEPLFFKEVSAMMTDIPVDDWKVYLRWNVINNAAPYLSSDLVAAHFDFYGKYLSGRQVNQPRWKRVLQSEDFALGEAIGQMFVKKHFPPEAKERMLDLVNNLKLALGERIKNLEWMSDTTKEQALEKLAAIHVKIGYPDVWRDYSDLEVKDDSYYQNMKRASHFNFLYEVNKIGKPVDPNDWGMTPQTVNAYYSPNRNEIVFPAGILQPPFFYLDADDAVNYGAIGVVIGHEMTHGFDDQGRQYDKVGNLRDWWTDDDAARFSKRAEVLIDEFNHFNVLDSTKANGALTIGENIADLGGLNISLTALRKAWEKNPPEKTINGFTPEQRFFLAYAHLWAQNITDKEILRRTKEDVHSLGRFRVNGPLPNLQAFYDAFNIPESSPMYLPVEKRAVIW